MTSPVPPHANADRWRRIEEICNEALERDASERRAFLEAACEGDDALRAEIESLLVHEQAAAGFLSAPLGAVAADALPLEPAQSLSGRRFGDYEFATSLGAGGMGEVYRARDHRLGRAVAIKVLPADSTA